jgi:UPF0042 nucleotide-binding protein
MLEQLISFGFKYGHPNDILPGPVSAIDIRTLFRHNPWRVSGLRKLPGNDPVVCQWMEQQPGFTTSYEVVKTMVQQAGERTVYLGCTGGRHRSVYLVERLADELGCLALHRDLAKHL